MKTIRSEFDTIWRRKNNIKLKKIFDIKIHVPCIIRLFNIYTQYYINSLCKIPQGILFTCL
jgi:hypothetical protein